jgi:PAS domain S-box-containing protein
MVDTRDDSHLAEALRAARARLRAVVESLPFDFWMTDSNGRYVMQNSACRERWGDVVGMRPEDLDVDPETRQLWIENGRRALGGETVREEVQYPVNGEPRHVYNVISPILDDDGELLGALGINLDITERKRVEQALRRRNEELEQLSRSKDQLTAMISHELRTPLVTGLGYIDMLLEGKLGQISERIRSRFTVAQRNLRRLAQLIDTVLKYQRVLSTGFRLATVSAPFDLVVLAREVVDDARGNDGGDRLTLDAAPRLQRVRGDREMIRMVLFNLIGNAVTHAGEGASIRIHLAPVIEGRVKVTVTDTGAGIPAAIRGSVFEPFVKGSTAATGSGLGLAIVRAILAAHDSDVELDSREGAGTSVSFLLPTE